MLGELADAAHVARRAHLVAEPAAHEEPPGVRVGDLEHRLGAAVEPGGDDPGRDAQLVHDGEQRVDTHTCAPVAAEIARNVGVLGLAEELGGRLRRDDVHPDVEDVGQRLLQSSSRAGAD